MANVISCIKCDNIAQKGGYNTWQIVVAVCFFPIGLLALLAQKKPNVCHKCGHVWD